MYVFSLFYCLCYVKDISTDMLEEQVWQDRYPDLNKDEDTRMEDSKDYNCRDIGEEGDNTKKIHDLKWEVYVKDK